ncbi:MAG: carbohydrate-binding domain-containing protein [Clostridia bacterium]|nr:carbohydrate-binding domain-containing protein [Clostridia bacterium]
MKTKNKILILTVVFSLICTALAGCAAKTGLESNSTADSSVTQAAAGEADEKNAVKITLGGTSAEISGSGAVNENGNIIITKGGTYSLSGEFTGGGIIVNADNENVTLILSGANITSQDSSAINIVKANSVTLAVKDGTENTLSDASEYSFDNDYSDEAQEEPNACVFSKSDLTITGSGKLTVNGNYKNGIKSKDMLTVKNANITINCENNALTGNDGVNVSESTLVITAKGDGIHSNSNVEINSGTLTIKSDDDAIHADNSVTINGGTIDADAHEGIEGTLITINDGSITINAGDDGINAAQKVDGVTPAVEINGGEITITMGAGDTDAIDSNGNIIINGGKISITGQSGFDYEGKAELNGGEVYVNGEKVTELTNQFGGSMPGAGGKPWGGFGGQNGGGFGEIPRDENGNFKRGGERGEMPQDSSTPVTAEESQM